MLLKYFLRKYAFLFLVSFGILAIICQVWKQQFLIVPYVLTGFIETLETVLPFILLLPVSFLLYDKYEIELGLTCAVRTGKLLLTKFLAKIIYIGIAMIGIVICYRYMEFIDFDLYKIIIPIDIPENFKMYMIISGIITVLFWSALWLLLRMLTNNCYVPVIVGIFLHQLLSGLNNNISSGTIDIQWSIIDPFASAYFLGDTVPEIYKLTKPLHAWTWNRCLFFVLSLVMIGISYLIARKEKVHLSND